MAIKAVYDTLEEIPEAFRELFTERNGKYELTGIEGVKTEADVERLSLSLQKERTEHGQTRDKLKLFGEVNPDGLQDSLHELTELRKLAEQSDDEKVRTLAERELTRRLQPLTRERDTLKTDLTDAMGRIDSFEAEARKTNIVDNLRNAAGEVGIRKEALPDIELRSGIFEIADDGNVITRDGVGVVPGLSTKEWLSEQVKTSTHWLETSTGANARGGSGGSLSNDKPASMQDLVGEVIDAK